MLVKTINLNPEKIIELTNVVNEMCEMCLLENETNAGLWLLQPKPFFDNKCAIDLINENKLDKVLDFLTLIERGEADLWEV